MDLHSSTFHPPVQHQYDLKEQLIRETIMKTQDKVEENSDKLDKIDEKLYQIITKK
jgi:ribosomal protein S6